MKDLKALVYTSWSEEREITELTSKLNDFEVVAQEYYHREKGEFSYTLVTKNKDVVHFLEWAESTGFQIKSVEEVEGVKVFHIWKTHPDSLHLNFKKEACSVFGLRFEIHYVEKDSQGRDKVIVY